MPEPVINTPPSFDDAPIDICVVTFSSDHTPQWDHYEMIRRCLLSILEQTDASRFRLSIGCNHPSPRVLDLVIGLSERENVSYLLGEACLDAKSKPAYPKYPLMRRLLRRVCSSWLVWFDDDSYVSDADWLDNLGKAIRANPDVAQFGKLADAPMMNPEPGWLRNADWYNPDVFCERIELTDGTQRIVCPYVVGGFYALRRDAMEKCRIPDARLFHNHGDWTTGLALKHQDFRIKHHVRGVAINTEPRRGIHENLWQPPGHAADLQRESIARDRHLFDNPLRFSEGRSD